MQKQFDVIVLGGGHAGTEACHAAAKMGAKTLLITLDKEKIGWMACNPSIGGLGKGHIVYELSALGGLMPKLCSPTYLQARMLNTKKGPAVQGLRLQIDKFKYNRLAVKTLSQLDNLKIYEGEAVELLLEGKDRVSGVRCKDGSTFYSSSLVITTGTFLNGKVHIGQESSIAGRMGEKSSQGLSGSIGAVLDLKLGRLKTGTPPRLLKSSIDCSRLQYQKPHDLEYLFEFDSVDPKELAPCYIAYTNEKTHKIIRDNLAKSAMYSGSISGVGPRYCPSIEDKVSRFASKSSHHVFIEPEGENHDEVYPAGLSTSLPLDVQLDYIRSIEGLERASITKAGYAVEYDFVAPTHLNHRLESKMVKGLFFAGQINGTTGYEEAAGQGIVAGINAALLTLGKDPFVLHRTESYIGVMVDDLVALGTDEPYRMFTSRAERRLLLRQDNAFLRLMPKGRELGLVDEETYEKFCEEKKVFEQCLEEVKNLRRSHELYRVFASLEFGPQEVDKARALLKEQVGIRGGISSRALLSVHANIKYMGYLEREKKEVEKALRYRSLELPEKMEYSTIAGLSVELAQKLSRLRPQNIAQAQLIPGMTPAAISILIFQTRLGQGRKMDSTVFSPDSSSSSGERSP